MERRNRTLSLGIVLLLIPLLGHLGGVLGHQAAGAKRLVVGQDADAASLDPHRTNDVRSLQVIRQLYDTLVVQGEDLQLQPGLALSWDQVDERTWEFRLREDVVFHNGEPFTAEDVKYSFDRLLDPATRGAGAFILSAIADVEVMDDFTVRIRTHEPFAPLLRHLAHPVASIIDATTVRAAGDDYGTRVVTGTGPFRFDEWVAGSHIILKGNPDWWGGPPELDEIVFRAIPDDTVRAIELETGGVDIAYRLEPVDRMRLESEPHIRLESVETLIASFIILNTQQPPLDDVRVRRAIHHAIDVDPLVEVIYEGQAVRTFGPLPPRVFGAHPDLEPYEYDPERARQLLAEAGYPDGFHTTLWTNEDLLRIQAAEVIQEYLRTVGITADIQVFEWGAYLQETAAGNHHMAFFGWSTVTGDADYGLYGLFHSSQWGAAGNRSFYRNPRVDELLDLARAAADPQARQEAYREVQEIVRDEVPMVFLWVLTDVVGMRANVEGFVPDPVGIHRLHRVAVR